MSQKEIISKETIIGDLKRLIDIMPKRGSGDLRMLLKDLKIKCWTQEELVWLNKQISKITEEQSILITSKKESQVKKKGEKTGFYRPLQGDKKIKQLEQEREKYDPNN